jgi:hypothetical protein
LLYIQGVVESCTDIWNRKYALKQGNSIGVRFIKYDIQGVFLKCAEILPTTLFDNVEDWEQLRKVVAQKINIILFFDIEFFKHFFRVLHEAGGS